MRWTVLALLAGCSQVFGLAAPTRASDAAVHDTAADTARDSGVTDTAVGLAPCDPFLVGIVACFDFEGSVTDASSSMLPVTTQDVAFVAGEAGSAVALGSTSAIHIPENPALDVNEVSIETWVRLGQLPVSGARMGVVDNDSEYGMFVLAQGVLECNITNMTLAGATLTAGVWTHVACVDDGMQLRQYVNGSLTASAASGAPTPNGTNGTSLGGNSPSGDPLIGDMDVVRIYDVARSAAQICSDAGRAACP